MKKQSEMNGIITRVVGFTVITAVIALGCGGSDDGKDDWVPDLTSGKADQVKVLDKGTIEFAPESSLGMVDSLALDQRHSYVFEGRQGGRIRVTQDALDPGLDSYLALVAPSGAALIEPGWNDGGEDRNARIDDFELTETGRHALMAMSYRDGSAGRYELRLTCLNDQCSPREVEPDLTLKEVRELTAKLVTAKFEYGTKYMGWAEFSNHCFTRARAVYYYFNFGGLLQFYEDEEAKQWEMVERIKEIEDPLVHEISFEFAGSVRIEGTFETDDAELASYLNDRFETGWTNHYASLVYTDAGPRIVDIAFSHEPLTIDEWKTFFLPEEFIGKCAFNDEEANKAILDYRIGKELGWDPPLPNPRCSFTVGEHFLNQDGDDLDDNDLFSTMWGDVGDFAFSSNFVMTTCADPHYMASHQDKIPLIRLKTTSIGYLDE